MKILLINFTDVGGGAAMAAVRLVESLNEHGVFARLGVPEKKSANPYVITLPKRKHCFVIKAWRKVGCFIVKLFAPITKRLPHPFAFRTSNGICHTTNFRSETDVNWVNNSDFDIVNLHWISGVICNKDIAKIQKPIVWTMHDSWPCCGAEHHPNIIENDVRWQKGYFRSNMPKTTKGIDLCRKVWKQKKKYLYNKNIVFISPSSWERDVLKSSALFGHCECKLIPNIIDHSVFYPKDKNFIKKLFGIPADKTILGFGAAYDIDNPRSMKGSYYLLDMLNKLKNPEEYFLVIFGPASEIFTSRVRLPFFVSGYISNQNILSCLYSVCDCVVNPSIIENLPTVCLESISCGVPVVAFDVGGTSDIVVHKETGFLATPYHVEELVEGVDWCVRNHDSLAQKCLEKSLCDFDEEKIVKKVIDAYNFVLKKVCE